MSISNQASGSKSNQSQQAPSRILTPVERKQADEFEDRLRCLPESQREAFFLELQRQDPIVAQHVNYEMTSKLQGETYPYRPKHGSVGEDGAVYKMVRTTGDKHPGWNLDPNDRNRGVGKGAPASSDKVFYLEEELTMKHNPGSK